MHSRFTGQQTRRVTAAARKARFFISGSVPEVIVDRVQKPHRQHRSLLLADPRCSVSGGTGEAVVYGPAMRLSSVGSPKAMLDVPINAVVADKDPPVERPL